MQGQSDRRTNSLLPASAISPTTRCSILPSRESESSGERSDLVSFPPPERSRARSDRSEAPCRKSRPHGAQTRNAQTAQLSDPFGLPL